MPNTLLSIDEYSVVDWEKYIVVTFFSNLQLHHLSLLDECFKKNPSFKTVPTVLDFVRIPEFTPREKSYALDLKQKLPQHVMVTNEALNLELQKAGFYHQLPIATDFKAALGQFGIAFQPKLDANFVNAFIQCTIKVFSAQTGEALTIGKPKAQKAPVLSDIFGIIPANSSHFSGMFLLSLPYDTLREMFFKVFKYQPEDVQCELESFLSEIVELIHETARTDLKNRGFIFYPSSATVLKHGHLAQYLNGNQLFLNIPLKFSNSTFQACIGVESSE